MRIPKIEYEVYSRLNGSKMIKLNLTKCEGLNLEINIPVKINDTIDKYNSSSDYYNNICSTTTSENGTDICLSDRKNDFITKNLTLCQENCDLIDYNSDSEKVICLCGIKQENSLLNEMKIDTNKLKKNFKDINNFANFKLMKCYKTIFTKKNIKKNYGCFIYVFIFISFLVCIFCFYFKYYDILLVEINSFISSIKQKINEKETKNIRFNKEDNYEMKKINNNINNKNYKTNKSIKRSNTIQDNSKIKYKITHYETMIISNNIDENILNNLELNSLNYEDAIKNDNRTFCQYYISLLKYNHLLIFSFYTKKDYNSRIIKFFLFIFFFGVHFFINSLFFNDSTLHQIYSKKGVFDFVYQLPLIIYSALISGVISALIKYLSLSDKNILDLNKEKENEKIDKKVNEINKKLKVKFSLFFLLTFLLLVFFWFYITCFCVIYKNTQIYLIKDTILSFISGLIYPFVIYLFPAFFRIISLINDKKNKKILYLFSKLLEKI